jgi:drug/metabolite transporter (DMT)-like permease
MESEARVRSTRAAPYVWMLVSAMSFAVMVALTYFLGGYCHWSAIAAVRAVSVLVLAVLATRLLRVPLIFWRPPSIWLRSISGTISLLCNFYAMTHLPPADTVTLQSLYPLWIAVLSWIWLRHSPSVKELLALASGLLGIVLIIQPAFDSTGLAMLAAVVGSFATAFAMLGLHQVRHVDAWAIVAHFSALASIAAVSSWLVADGAWPNTSLPTTSLILLLGLVGVCATVGQFCMTKAYAKGQPTSVGVAGLTQVVFAMLIDVVFWNRSFTAEILLGIVLVVAPSAWLLVRKAPLEDAEYEAPRSAPRPVAQPQAEQV